MQYFCCSKLTYDHFVLGMASSSWRWWTTDTYFGISAWASLASAMMSTCMGRSPLGHLLENYQVAAPRSISGTEITPIVLYNQAFPHQEPDEAFPPVWITLRRKAAITTPSPRLGVLWRTRLGVVKARIRIILKQTEVRIDNVIAVVRACCIYTMSARRPMTAWTSSGSKMSGKWRRTSLEQPSHKTKARWTVALQCALRLMQTLRLTHPPGATKPQQRHCNLFRNDLFLEANCACVKDVFASLFIVFQSVPGKQRGSTFISAFLDYISFYVNRRDKIECKENK